MDAGKVGSLWEGRLRHIVISLRTTTPGQLESTLKGELVLRGTFSDQKSPESFRSASVKL